MAKKRGTSNVPIIMGIIGGLLGIPAAYWSGACAGVVGVVGGEGAHANEIAQFYLYMGLLGAILGFIGGLLGKRMPKFAGIIMLIAAFMAGYTLIAGNMLALVVAVLFLIGGVFCFVQKKVPVEETSKTEE